MVSLILTKRRIIIAIAVAISVTSLVFFSRDGQEVAYDDSGLNAGEFLQELTVPPLLEDTDPDPQKAHFELTADSG